MAESVVKGNGAEVSNAEKQPPPDKNQDNSKQSDYKNIEEMKDKAGLPKSKVEEGFHKHFLHPMLAKMEMQVSKNNDMLDEIQRKWDIEKEKERKERLGAHIPGPLKGEGQELDSIMSHIQNLIVYENFNNENVDVSKLIPATLKELDQHAEVAVLGHSIAAFVSTLDPTHLRQFATRIISDTTLWISRLFRFSDSSAYFHDDEREGIVRICRLALYQKYPKFATDGYDTLFTRTPIIYISSAAKQGLGHYICSQLGLPISCLSTVPTEMKPGFQQKMDLTALEKLISDDVASAKMPVMIIAYAGSPLLGHVDNITKLQDICKKNEIWLHVEGNNLATLTMYSVPTSVSPAKSGDSMTLNLGGWLGLPAVPHVTLYKMADPALAHAVGLTTFNLRAKLSCLPLWLCLQSLGHEGVMKRVKHAIDLAKLMREKLEPIESLKLVGKKCDEEDDDSKPKKYGLREIITKAIEALVIFELENPSLVFRYQGLIPIQKPDLTKIENEDEEAGVDASEMESYFDALNLWLSETMKREIPKVQVNTVEVEGEGICIRFCPLETATSKLPDCDIQTSNVEEFVQCLVQQLGILDATVCQRADFQDIVQAQDNLVLVHLPNWAGLGAIQYIPDHLVKELDNLTDDGRKEIHGMNAQLVYQLKSSDTAFSLGCSSDGLACVRFGLITEETDLEELIGLVYTTGREVEESSRFLETMTEVVRQGIEKANEDLNRENKEKLQQEGVLRQVPLVGSLINWWSPPGKDVGIKGRTFSLTSGQVESTESTYKYHMQVQAAPLDQTPKSRQGPLKQNLKPGKSRTLSSSSQHSSQSGSSQDKTNASQAASSTQPQQETAEPQKENNQEISQEAPPAKTTEEEK